MDPDSGQQGGREGRVIELLRERGRRVTVGELADEVSRADTADTYDAVHEDLFKRVLPSLEEGDRVRFDESRGVVSLSRTRWFLSLVPSARRRWVLLCALVLAIGTSLFAFL